MSRPAPLAGLLRYLGVSVKEVMVLIGSAIIIAETRITEQRPAGRLGSIPSWLTVHAGFLVRPLAWIWGAALIFLTLRYLQRLYNKWILIRFDDLPVLFFIDPVLRFVNWYRRETFDLATLQASMKLFVLPTGSACYQFNARPIATLSTDPLRVSERPLIVLKLPIRKHLAVPDAVDLRLLRSIIAAGGRVLVVLLDVAHPIDPSEVAAAFARTERFVNKFLGSSARIVRLSTVLSERAPEFVRFILDRYVPFYARQQETGRRSMAEASERELVSYFTFALFLKTLGMIAKPREPVIVLQWQERLGKWDAFSAVIHEWVPDLRIAGFVVADSFPDFGAGKWPTSLEHHTPFTFALTDQAAVVDAKILSILSAADCAAVGVSAETYVQNLAHILFGTPNRNDPSRGDRRRGRSTDVLRTRFVDRFKKLQKEMMQGMRG